MKRWACKADNRVWLTVSPWLSSFTKKESPSTTTTAIHETLPTTPRELIAKRTVYELPVLNSRVLPEGDEHLKALYRIYEHLLLDQWLDIRNEFESFWYHSSWSICEIPDPKDTDPERYARLACIPKLLRAAFNQRIQFGLPRDAPPIFTGEMMEEWKKRDTQFEELPAWVEGVPPVRDLLAIPHWDNSTRDFVTLTEFEDEGASSEAYGEIMGWNDTFAFDDADAVLVLHLSRRQGCLVGMPRRKRPW